MKKYLSLFLIAILCITSIPMIHAQEKNEIGNDIKPMYEVDEGAEEDYIKYFNRTRWIKRDDGWTLSCEPSNFLKNNRKNSEHVEKAFNALYYKHHRSPLWYNESSLKAQFECHAYHIVPKYPWNIEPWRTDFNPIFCN